MKQILTHGIILFRTDFGEADRILTVLTPDHGKLRLMAKGVRKSTSKLAGGIELFSISELSFIPGKGEIGTLVSTRLHRHFGNIVKDISRTMLGYELIKRLNKSTEDAAGREYFDLLSATFEGLDDSNLPPELLTAWFDAQLLKLAGHQPNLRTDATGQKLDVGTLYTFDLENMAFIPHEQGMYTANHIKFLRLVFGIDSPEVLGQVKDIDSVLQRGSQLVRSMAQQFLRA